MTLLLYDDVLNTIDSTPKTVMDITNILFSDLKFESDKVSKSQGVAKAARQLVKEGKIAHERMEIDGHFKTVYFSKNQTIPVKESVSEQVLNALRGNSTWHTVREVVTAVYGADTAEYHNHRARIINALTALKDDGLAVTKKSEEPASNGVILNMWRIADAL